MNVLSQTIAACFLTVAGLIAGGATAFASEDLADYSCIFQEYVNRVGIERRLLTLDRMQNRHTHVNANIGQVRVTVGSTGSIEQQGIYGWIRQDNDDGIANDPGADANTYDRSFSTGLSTKISGHCPVGVVSF